MNFQLNEEQSLLRDALMSYLREHQMPVVGAEPGWVAAAWRDLARDLGVQGALFPEALGGIGGGPLEAMIIMEALGESLVSLPFLTAIVLAGGLVRAAGGAAAAPLIEALISGDIILAFAHSESDARDCRSHVATTATASGEGSKFVLHGDKAVLYAAPDATHLLVSARTSGDRRDAHGISLFLVERDRAGVTLRNFALIDGSSAADVHFSGVEVSERDLLGRLGEAMPLIEHALDSAVAGLCAETVGCMRAMFELTVRHVQERKQFGQPLSSFQVLRHRIVEMYIKLEHSISLAHAAAVMLRDGRGATWLCSAAKAYIGRAGDFIGRYSVQIHGGVGMMEESLIARYFKRMLVIQRQFGSTEHHLGRFASVAGMTIPEDRILSADSATVRPAADMPVLDASMESKEDAQFRADVRQFIDQHLTGDLRRLAHQEACSFGHPQITHPWQRLLHERGWVAPAWPAEHGGPGWTARQRYIFEFEMAVAGAPRLPAMGLQMVGPVIIKFGTPQQKAFFLPKILSGEHYWCQGYSEPGSGSDLASLQTRAVREGDDYVLNGSKLWTTFAHYASWIFLLVRTSSGRKPQGGITFLVAPMNTPGISVRPLISVSGEHEVNQVFFDDVRVPVSNRIGEEGAGWSVARYLLEFERGVGHQVPALFAELAKLRTMAQLEPGEEGDRLWDDRDFARRFAELEIEALAAFFTEQRRVYSLPAGQNVGDTTASLMKLAWSKTAQRIDHLALDAIGAYSAADQRQSFGSAPATAVVGPRYAQMPMTKYLNDRAMTIAGGSNEIQRNILARILLGP